MPVQPLVVEMVPDKETANKMRFKEPNARGGRNLFKSPIGTVYAPKEGWSEATRIRVTLEDISDEETKSDGTK